MGVVMKKKKEKCHVIDAVCNDYCYQYEINSTSIAIEFCNHKDNPNEYEGNCKMELCPLINNFDKSRYEHFKA
jgi:hypothetical protein